MRLLVCLGFFLAATGANAQSATNVKREGNTIIITGPTTTTTIRRNGGYQPMGLAGYRPMGASGYRPMGH